ncbi:tRNA dimethylallyltransferase [Brevinema andersonii]|uniref:tRNA dimethylallyltransferase n=1 Tax=Brevinema andersonii TaxID=34097 RepID=A0A1I1F7L2_BREAD|nr:tRNA (adenosine(37)-N6)-dimethylallyltransferase MiaA [Brevinema andersonii]SFB95307.1 tRNA dimethylallyltransferase [Brevinema andersonii]
MTQKTQNNNAINVLAIVGPTAAGKSALAMEYASLVNGEIVSCDSVQVYKFLDIGSAKPSISDRQNIPHYLIDILKPNEPCNVGFWRDKAIESVTTINNKGKVPIIVGGTGLYFKALYYGLFQENAKNEVYRNYLEEKSKALGYDYLYKQLQLKDPLYAQKIHKNDKKRIIRALEAIYVTERPFSALHNQNVRPLWNWHWIYINDSRENIYFNIEQRVNLMIKQGLIDETKVLFDIFGPCCALDAIGYRHVVLFLLNKLSKDTMVQTLIKDTRNFAKRQISLFNNLLKGKKILTESEIIQQFK